MGEERTRHRRQDSSRDTDNLARLVSLSLSKQQVVNQKTCSEIEKDVPRTFPDVPGFNDPVGQRRLMRMLRSYALLDPEVSTH